MNTSRCSACRENTPLPTPITMAFQPIVDTTTGKAFAHEALVRGTDGATAAQILAGIDDTNRYAFDQSCRVKSIELAARLQLPTRLSINFMPNAVYNPQHCLRATLTAAETHGWPPQRIIFEVTEQEQVSDPKHLRLILSTYRSHGFSTAIDDFGAGYAGLNLLADFQPDFIKLDMALIRAIDHDPVRRAITSHMVSLCRALNVEVIAEGIETLDEYKALRDLGITLFQGYLFARPRVEALPQIQWPTV